MDKKAKIYVAGHRGLVGSAILEGLSERGYSNITVRTSRELDLRRQSEVEAFFADERPEYVFLAAAKVGGILANNTYRAEFIYDNMMIAANVINTAHLAGVKKLLNLGSSCIYPKLAPQPMKEEHLLTGALEPTNEPYAIAKIAAIKLCRYYNEQYGTNYISAMPTNLYGPGDNYDLKGSHVLPALIRKFHLAKLLKEGKRNEAREDLGFASDSAFDATLREHGVSAEAVTIWGSGEPMREFLYSKDLADACIFLMENCGAGKIGEIINVGAGKDLKIKELALIVRDVVGFSGGIRHDLSKPDGTHRKLLDVSRINGLGWKATTELKDGIRLAYESYLERLDQ
jgi:GDP-L-fucose synthase